MNEPYILVVEDDLEIRESLSMVLEDEGYQVKLAVNGKEALTFLERAPLLPNLILLDVMMPVMTGSEFRKHQIERENLSKIPVIVLTADRSFPLIMKELKITHFLKKPVDLNDLIALVASLY